MKLSPSLHTLASSPSESAPARRIPAWILPTAIAAGFILLFLGLFRDRLLPAPSVDVARVLAAPSEPGTPAEAAAENVTEGEMAFQASGWIEPDPLPIKAVSLIDGVVAVVHVLEGQNVKSGEILASLIADDARLALAAAKQTHNTAVSDRAAHLAAIDATRKKLEGAQAETEAATALRDEAADLLERLTGLPAGAVPQADVVAAQLKVNREESQLRAAKSAAEGIAAESQRLELETQVKDHQIAAAAIEVDKAALALDRTQITSPIDGRILRLLAAPGQKKMLQDNDPESSTIAILYDPAKLQVRVDVPLADAAGLQTGQSARIRCSLLPDNIFKGSVTRITGEANLQRNTLQAKVRIADPSDLLRPEMLCRVEFLRTRDPSGDRLQSSGALSCWVPESAVQDGNAWVCDPGSKRVSKRAIRARDETRDGFVRIAEGLRPGEWVVLSPKGLRVNQRVNPHLVEP